MCIRDSSNTVTLKTKNLAFLILQVLYKYLQMLYKRVLLNLQRLLHQHNNLVGLQVKIVQVLKTALERI